MTHQRPKRPHVGPAVFLAERRQNFQRPTVFQTSPRKTLPVRFDPRRRIAGHAVFPRTEPKQNQPQMISPGLLQQPVNPRKIKLVLLRLNLIPIHRHQHRIQMHLHQPGPDGLQIRQFRCRRIAHQAVSCAWGVALHHQLNGLSLPPQKRNALIPLISGGCAKAHRHHHRHNQTGAVHRLSLFRNPQNNFLEVFIPGRIAHHNFKLPRFDGIFHIRIVKSQLFRSNRQGDGFGLSGLEGNPLKPLQLLNRQRYRTDAVPDIQLDHLIARHGADIRHIHQAPAWTRL